MIPLILFFLYLLYINIHHMFPPLPPELILTPSEQGHREERTVTHVDVYECFLQRQPRVSGCE